MEYLRFAVDLVGTGVVLVWYLAVFLVGACVVWSIVSWLWCAVFQDPAENERQMRGKK